MGSISTPFVEGKAKLSNIEFYGIPGETAIDKFALDSLAFNKPLLSITKANLDPRLIINAEFRECIAGEEQTVKNLCSFCEANTYSLLPNSRECIPCMDHARCQGGTELFVDPGYWRIST